MRFAMGGGAFLGAGGQALTLLKRAMKRYAAFIGKKLL